jgi:hypothetical protein
MIGHESSLSGSQDAKGSEMSRWFIPVVFMISMTIPGAALAQQAATVVITLPQLNMEPDSQETASVAIECQPQMCSAFDIALQFDPQIVHVDALQVGSYLGEVGLEVIVLDQNINNETGVLRLAAAALASPPHTATNALIDMQFTAVSAGTASLEVSHAEVGDLMGNRLQVEFTKGEIIVAIPQATCEYVVRSGDVLSGIASANEVSVASIMELNNITDARFIRVGQVLTIPAASCASPEPDDEQTSTGTANSSEIKEVWDCTYIGGGEFEWYHVRINYGADSKPVSVQRLEGPLTGPWQSGCPADPTANQNGSNGGDNGGGSNSGGGSSGGGDPFPR